ncbi:uncharacterized protein LOC121398175 [Xenopus laevis]|uniref:Uncharacterized protein LOC121398175 n=1 Tax=Xenopus laevis TaxID=8355 RepID=A0A8J1LV42_XENLA|nr:uncharacterized protein LOC121398175 [Xenopus laevis]
MVPPEIPERRSFKTKSMRREPITQTSSGLGECSRSLLPKYSPKGSLLSEEERKVAEKAKQRTLRILFDALEKKDSLLVVKPEDFVGIPKKKTFPLIPLNLVQDLIINLLSVTFRKSYCAIPETFELLQGSDEIVIYLSPHFWHQKEMLGQGSRPGTLILELSRVLGYKRYLGSPTDEREEQAQQGQQKFPLTASEICSVFEKWMCHSGSYFGYYSCCGEKSVDSVCDILTGPSHHLLSDKE